MGKHLGCYLRPSLSPDAAAVIAVLRFRGPYCSFWCRLRFLCALAVVLLPCSGPSRSFPAWSPALLLVCGLWAVLGWLLPPVLLPGGALVWPFGVLLRPSSLACGLPARCSLALCPFSRLPRGEGSLGNHPFSGASAHSQMSPQMPLRSGVLARRPSPRR